MGIQPLTVLDLQWTENMLQLAHTCAKAVLNSLNPRCDKHAVLCHADDSHSCMHTYLHSANSGFWKMLAMTLAPYEWLMTIALLPQLAFTAREMSSAIRWSPPVCTAQTASTAVCIPCCSAASCPSTYVCAYAAAPVRASACASPLPTTHLLKTLNTDAPVKRYDVEIFAGHVAMLFEQVS